MADTSDGGGQIRQVSEELPLDRAVAVQLGTQIRELRESRRLTQEKLADEVGLTRNHIQLLESGLSDRAKNSPANPRLSTLLALSQALGARLRIDTVTNSKVIIELVEPE
jgi:transcriptional regulator with XRE-family HTH domain